MLIDHLGMWIGEKNSFMNSFNERKFLFQVRHTNALKGPNAFQTFYLTEERYNLLQFSLYYAMVARVFIYSENA